MELRKRASDQLSAALQVCVMELAVLSSLQACNLCACLRACLHAHCSRDSVLVQLQPTGGCTEQVVGFLPVFVTVPVVLQLWLTGGGTNYVLFDAMQVAADELHKEGIEKDKIAVPSMVGLAVETALFQALGGSVLNAHSPIWFSSFSNELCRAR